MRHAEEILLLSKTMNAERAERVGSLTRCAKPASWKTPCEPWRASFQDSRPIFVAENKRDLNRVYESIGLPESIALCEDIFVFTAVLPDKLKVELREPCLALLR